MPTGAGGRRVRACEPHRKMRCTPHLRGPRPAFTPRPGRQSAETLLIDPHRPDRNCHTMPYAIEAELLQKTFTGKHTVHALDGVSFNVEEGTVFGLLGPNGSGKTTAVRILTTILKPDGGVARVLGHDVAKKASLVPEPDRAGRPVRRRRREPDRPGEPRDGRQPQPPRSVLGRAGRAKELLVQFDLADAGDRTLKTYSGGMRRRLDLAAALVARPTVLFLDEPTTGLDPQSRNDLWEVIERLVGRGHHRPAHHPVPRGGRPAGQHPGRARPRAGHRRRHAGDVEGGPGGDRAGGRAGHHRRRHPDRRAPRLPRASPTLP